ncbi:RE1 [Symbiodinium sp. CCMP2592]|nr:RE1 [Symbiodinium sp. CCMP2592]
MDLNLEDLRKALRDLGEDPSPSWTKVELRYRLQELTGKDTSINVKTPAKDTSPMLGLVKKLNAASRKKQDLVTFCRDEISMDMSGLENKTIAQLQMLAMKQISSHTALHPTDLLGFGKHVRRTYLDVAQNEKEYCSWVKTTAEENPHNSDPRLRRFARWLQLQEDCEILPEVAPKKDFTTQFRPAARNSSTKKSTEATNSASASSSSEAMNQQMMATMFEMIKDLRGEIAELKGEPVRKKGVKPEESGTETDGSYAMVTVQKSGAIETLNFEGDEGSLGDFDSEEVFLLREEIESVEEIAQKLPGNADFRHDSCEQLLEMIPYKAQKHHRSMLGSQPASYIALGAFSHGNHYGVTQRTKQIPQTVKYLLRYMNHWNKGSFTCTSLVINHNAQCPLHRDVHNDPDYLNRIIGLGSYTQGKLWVECPDLSVPQNLTRKVLPNGAVANGQLHDIRHRLVAFPPKAWHGPEDWNAHPEILKMALPPKWHTVSTDIGHWKHPKTGEVVQFMLIIDEGAAACLQYLREGWGSYFGLPRALRLDPAGAFRSQSVVDFCDREHILLDIVAADAHWQIGVCEQAIKGVKEVMSKMCDDDDQATPETLLATAVSVFNQRDQVRGFSPVQHAFGRSPDITGRIVTSCNQFEDVSEEGPTDAEWYRAQDVQEETPPLRFRVRSPRPRVGSPSSLFLSGESERWTSQVPESAWSAECVSFWEDQSAAVEVEIDMPNTARQWERATANLSAYFTGALKRQAVEVSEKRLSPQELAQFKEAKMIEVKNFLAAKAFEVLPKHLQPSKEQAIGMRWVLTWKTKDSGEVKAKARAVLLGYQDPAYEHRATTAPVMTRQTRQMLLQVAANHRWNVYKGDVSGAFLQGREYPGSLFCIPCDEICDCMNIPRGSVTKLKRACYGLVDAPLEWYKTVSEFLESLGLERLWSDACSWVWRSEGRIQAMVSGHVDDFLFSGNEDNPRWNEIVRKIKERFHWGDWVCNEFIQCGVKVSKTETGFCLSQEKYVEEIPEIPISSTRRKDSKAATTGWEKTQLRALLGALSWHAQQVAPHISAEVGILLSEVNTSTVQHLTQANQLLQSTRARKGHRMLIHGFGPTTELGMYAWVDAASQNRHDGGSTQGVFIGIAPVALLKGEVCPITPISWHSHKIDRVCRSPGAAETQAAVNGEDQLVYARYQWSEILYGNVDTKDPDTTVRRTTGCVISDSRNVYDKLQTEVLSIKGAEKRANLELLALKEAQSRTNVHIRWVHSEAQLANTLTKANGGRELELFYRMGHQWRIVEDDRMRSARKRKAEGMSPLQQESTAVQTPEEQD